MRILDCEGAEPLPPELNGKLTAAVTPKPGSAWQDLYFTRDSAHFAERPVGQFFEMIVKFRAPRDNEASLSHIKDLRRKRWIVEITDMNGIKKIAGRENEGCSINMDLRDHGQNRRDSNHYNMIISLVRTEEVPFSFD